MKNIVLLIFLSLTLSCSSGIKLSEPIEPKPIAQSTTQPQKSEIKSLIDFFSLANKSVYEIEKIYGKPLLVDAKSVQFKDGEYRHYKMFDEKPLQIDYYKGKGVHFT